MADSPLTIHIEDPDNSVRVDPDTGSIETDTPDGGVVVQLDAMRQSAAKKDEGFYANLADEMDSVELNQIANKLIDEIEEDNRSRQQWLENRKKGLKLLGIQLEEPKSTVADSGSAMDGISVVTNPLMLQAILKGWAGARAELLPAEGPAKVQQVLGDETDQEDDTAETLERDFNYYLTKIAREYYPETSHMLLWGTYFGGSGFKKTYRCPLKQRPVSPAVDASDLIVSDTMKDFSSCARITHEIKMRSSVLKRMQLVGAYRQIDLGQPTPVQNAPQQAVGEMQGTKPSTRPEDQPYTIWETQCELDLPQYAPTQFKNEGIPLPYRVTIDKDGRQILALRRDWNENDPECARKRLYTKYPYVPGPGFYGTGYLGILGNITAAMTAVDRECLDSGMLANFPGGVVNKAATRQLSSNLRQGPGEFVGLDVPAGMNIQNVIMPTPYRDIMPGLMQLRQALIGQAKELSSSIELPEGEGVQDIPVGSMMAQIEQSQKVSAAAFKDMHVAQQEEFELIIDLFRENPEDFWRGNEAAKTYWDETKLLQALHDFHLVPRSDPNTPSHLHRVAKAVALVQLAQAFPMVLNPLETAKRVLRAMKEDPTGLIQEPQQGGPDPTQMMIGQAQMITAQAKQMDAQTKAQKVQLDAASNKDDSAIKAAQLAQEQQIANTKLATEQVIHAHDAQRDAAELQHTMVMDQAAHALSERQAAHSANMDHAAHQLNQNQAAMDHQRSQQEHELNVHQAMNPPMPRGPGGP